MKCLAVLSKLRTDHAMFERVFCEIELQCRDLADCGTMDRWRVAASMWFLREYEAQFHHQIEERISAYLNQHLTKFGGDIYDISGDHALCCREFDRFSQCTEGGVLRGCPAEEFVDRAKSYIGCERAHFIAEEELFFPYAARCLTHEQWRAVEETADLAEIDVSASPYARELRLIFEIA